MYNTDDRRAENELRYGCGVRGSRWRARKGIDHRGGEWVENVAREGGGGVVSESKRGMEQGVGGLEVAKNSPPWRHGALPHHTLASANLSVTVPPSPPAIHTGRQHGEKPARFHQQHFGSVRFWSRGILGYQRGARQPLDWDMRPGVGKKKKKNLH